MSGILYIVATPIGNLEDITFRSVRILKEVDKILCEDTRHSGVLLKHYEIKNKLLSYHMHNENSRTEEIIDLLLGGENIALISDAGMPGISDPGFVIVKEAKKKDIKVEVLPGASASIVALVGSGFSGGSFYFHGFLPKKTSEKKNLLESFKNIKCPIIIYESPNRLKSLLEDINEVFPEREVAICRELTKLYEEVKTGYAAELLEGLPERVRGEIVVVLGNFEEVEEEIDFKNMLKSYIENGDTKSIAVKKIAKEYKVSKNILYKISLEIDAE